MSSAELFVEIKGAGIESLVVDVLAAYDGATAIHSFDHAMIGRLADRGVPYRLGLLFEDDVSSASTTMRELGALDVWPHHSIVIRASPRRRSRRWWSRHCLDGERCDSGPRAGFVAGVDGLCTDDVSMLDGL